MKFSTEKPPNWNEITKHFPVEWDGVIVTYGDTIHCNKEIGPQKEAHESIHISYQLEMGVEEWWKKYFEDPNFRLLQETVAYLNEAKWIQDNIKDKNARFKKLNQIATDLSSPMYGNIISKEEAKTLFNYYK